MREKDFDVVMGGNKSSPETESARWEAMSIRSEIGEAAKQTREESNG